MQILSFLVFVVLQILFLPLVVLGVAWVAYTQMVVSKRIGVSQTAIEVINGRWTMHVFGMRDDPASAKLAAASGRHCRRLHVVQPRGVGSVR